MAAITGLRAVGRNAPTAPTNADAALAGQTDTKLA